MSLKPLEELITKYLNTTRDFVEVEEIIQELKKVYKEMII